MLRLFTDPLQNYVLTYFNDVKEIIKSNQDKAMAYYSTAAVPPRNSKSLLYRLTMSLPDPMSYTLEEYLSPDQSLSMQKKAATLGFNTQNRYNGFITGTLFIHIPEFPSAVVGSVNKYLFSDKIDTTNMLRFYHHPSSSLEFPRLGYKDYQTNWGYSVWELDITSLMYNYYRWYNDNLGMTDIDVFISTVLIPSSIPSFTDISVINSFLKGVYTEDSEFPKSLTSVETRFNKYIMLQYAKLDKFRDPKDYKAILGSIPTVNSSITKLYKPADEAPTQYVMMKRILAIMAIWNNIAAYSNSIDTRRNEAYNRDLRIMARMAPGSLESMFGKIPESYFEPRLELERLITVLK